MMKPLKRPPGFCPITVLLDVVFKVVIRDAVRAGNSDRSDFPRMDKLIYFGVANKKKFGYVFRFVIFGHWFIPRCFSILIILFSKSDNRLYPDFLFRQYSSLHFVLQKICHSRFFSNLEPQFKHSAIMTRDLVFSLPISRYNAFNGLFLSPSWMSFLIRYFVWKCGSTLSLRNCQIVLGFLPILFATSSMVRSCSAIKTLRCSLSLFMI